jgi:hypothetical protein
MHPSAVVTRIWQVASASVGVVTSLAADYLIGNTEDMEVRTLLIIVIIIVIYTVYCIIVFCTL